MKIMSIMFAGLAALELYVCIKALFVSVLPGANYTLMFEVSLTMVVCVVASVIMSMFFWREAR